MKDSNVEIVLRFNKEKGVEDLMIDQNYIVTTSWRWDTCFVSKNLWFDGACILVRGCNWLKVRKKGVVG
jgi:hypothetical protein